MSKPQADFVFRYVFIAHDEKQSSRKKRICRHARIEAERKKRSDACGRLRSSKFLLEKSGRSPYPLPDLPAKDEHLSPEVTPSARTQLPLQTTKSSCQGTKNTIRNVEAGNREMIFINQRSEPLRLGRLEGDEKLVSSRVTNGHQAIGSQHYPCFQDPCLDNVSDMTWVPVPNLEMSHVDEAMIPDWEQFPFSCPQSGVLAEAFEELLEPHVRREDCVWEWTSGGSSAWSHDEEWQ